MKTKIKIISNVLLLLLLGVQLLTIPVAIAQAITITPADDAWCQNKTGESCAKAFYDNKISTIDVINSRTPAPAANPAATAPATAGTTLEDCTGSLTKPGDESKCAPEVAANTDDATKQEQYCQTVYKMSCSEYAAKNATPAEKAAADKVAADKKAAEAEKAAADKADEEACASASKAHFNNDIGLTCEEYKKALEVECKDPSKNLDAKGNPIEYSSCADKAAAEKNLRGQGFKLNLNALTLTSGGQKSGSAIFENKDYKQYGPLVGTLMRVIDMLILIIGSLAMLTLILAGIFMITNHGDEAWVTKGKTMMLYSVLGLLAAFLSFAIVNVIQSALA